jgi:hypothetical protein
MKRGSPRRPRAPRHGSKRVSAPGRSLARYRCRVRERRPDSFAGTVAAIRAVLEAAGVINIRNALMRAIEAAERKARE